MTLEVELISRSDGVFELEDKTLPSGRLAGQDHPDGAFSGGEASQGLTILLTSKKLPPFDLGQWRSQGVNPEEPSA